MLSTALPTLQNDIKSALQMSAKSAAYNAVVAMWGQQPTNETDSIAQDFAEKFSKVFAEKASPLLANAINSFVMQAQPYIPSIPVTTPVGPGTAAAPPGTILML